MEPSLLAGLAFMDGEAQTRQSDIYIDIYCDSLNVPMFVNFLQILKGMEAQELVIIPVRDKGTDAKFLKAYSTSAGLTTIQINISKHSSAVVCEICSLSQ